LTSGAREGRHARDSVDILDGDRDAAERRGVGPGQPRIRQTRGLTRTLGVEMLVGVESVSVLRVARQRRFRQLARRDLAGAELSRDVTERTRVSVGHLTVVSEHELHAVVSRLEECHDGLKLVT
jgi:hypothetical protein